MGQEAYLAEMSFFNDRKRCRGEPNTDDDSSTPGTSKRRMPDGDFDSDDRGYQKDRASGTFSHEDYTVGWICALPIEMAAAKAMLDNVHEELPHNRNDTNTYILGNIAMHNIIIACLPSSHYGTNNAATVASNMCRSFPSIRVGLIVGIGGGIPGKVDIRLGDVVVGDKGVVQFDIGKEVGESQLKRTGTLNKPPHALLTAVAKLRADHVSKPSQMPSILSKMHEKCPQMTEYTHRGSLQDRLFDGTYDHVRPMESCEHCDTSRLVNRPARLNANPEIHYGAIASGNQVMKHGRTRDQLAQELGVICFEMEAAGVMDSFPCLVIRGICDYSDSHKNKQWQEYAAATAAAYAKELLSVIPTNGVKRMLKVLSADPDRQKHLLKSLKFEQIDARRAGIKPNHGETCQWLLKHSDYLDWLDPEKAAEHHGFLWIKGKPGAGKSTIMNFAYSQAMKAKAGTVISFFFNARGDILERSTAGMYRSLLFQLLNALPRLTDVFNGSEHKNIVDELHETIMNQSANPEWQVEVLQGLLRSAMAMIDQQPLIVFVDALDECDMEQVEEMVEFFEDSGKSAVSRGSRLKICFSSRHYPHIDIQYGRKLSLELQEGHEKDIATYIQSKLRVGKSKTADEIKNKMRNKAGGIFMWVVLVTGILNSEYKGGRIFDVRKRLDAIPTKLSDLFREILWRDQKNLPDLQLCIQWILFAKRPLKLEEYYFAAVSGLSPDELCEWDPEDITTEDMSRFVLSSSKGLAETTKSKSPTVQFIHESVREFFLKDGLQELWPDLTADFQSFSHLQLQQCCQAYLKLDISAYVPFGTPLPKASSDPAKNLRSSVSDKFPFLEYATRHVLFHANAAAKGFPQGEFLETFELGPWIHLDNLFQIYDIRRHTPYASLVYILAENNLANLISTALLFDSRIDFQGERHDYPLFAALANGHKDAVRALLQNEASCPEDDISAPLEYGNALTYHKSQTPLSWAAQHGHESVVRQLLTRAEIDVNTRDKLNYTPLSWAAKNGHVAVVEQLLTRDEVDINPKDVHGLTPLSLAVANGHESVVDLLLATDGIDVETQDSFDQRPLLLAARNGYEAIVKQLLARHGIDVDSQDSFGQTTLWWAARRGHESMAKLLLDTGKVEVNAKDDDGQTPLLCAAMEGYEAVVKLLLDTGKADVNAKDKYGRAPLSWAAREGREAIVEQLLARDDVNVSIKDRYGQTPLSLAAAKGHKSIVEQLLARDTVDINMKDGSYSRTPLSLAAVKGHESVVEHLLARDNIDVDTSDSYGLTPLSLAAANGRTSVVEQLLARDDVDVNAKDSRYGRTPLSLAAENGYESVVEQLLAKDSVDVDTKDSYDRTPLSWAAENGHQSVVKQLLARDGVNVDAKDRYGQTPLSWAAENGNGKVVQLLVDNGKADINSRENHGRTPLLWAAMKGHETVVKLLLATGKADINAKDNDGQTPLLWAAKNRHKAVRRLLQSTK